MHFVSTSNEQYMVNHDQKYLSATAAIRSTYHHRENIKSFCSHTNGDLPLIKLRPKQIRTG